MAKQGKVELTTDDSSSLGFALRNIRVDRTLSRSRRRERKRRGRRAFRAGGRDGVQRGRGDRFGCRFRVSYATTRVRRQIKV